MRRPYGTKIFREYHHPISGPNRTPIRSEIEGRSRVVELEAPESQSHRPTRDSAVVRREFTTSVVSSVACKAAAGLAAEGRSVDVEAAAAFAWLALGMDVRCLFRRLRPFEP